MPIVPQLKASDLASATPGSEAKERLCFQLVQCQKCAIAQDFMTTLNYPSPYLQRRKASSRPMKLSELDLKLFTKSTSETPTYDMC